MPDKNEMETLFPEVEVEGYKIKPWCLGELALLSSSFQRLIKSFETEGITLDNFGDDMTKIVFCLLSEAPHILAVTLKESPDIVNAFDLKRAQLLVLTIINQNVDYLKNLFGLGMTPKKEV